MVQQNHPQQGRIGELLSRIIPLSSHDVEEILHEQSASNQRFGDIALQLGLCKPDDVLRAWLHQLETRTDRVSIDRLGVDTQALVHLDARTARELRAVPIRAIEELVLIAVAHLPDEHGMARLEASAGRRVRLVLADESELDRAIARHYPAAGGLSSRMAADLFAAAD